MVGLYIKKKWLTMIMIFIAALGAYFTILTIQASTDFWIDKTTYFTTFGDHWITLNSKNGGGQLDADFYLTVTLVNASFSSKTEMPYNLVNASIAKFSYVLHQGESARKDVYFSIDEGTTEFSISLGLEKKNFFDMLKPNPLYPTTLQYKWNDNAQTYQLVE